jgi:hypothetical protein
MLRFPGRLTVRSASRALRMRSGEDHIRKEALTPLAPVGASCCLRRLRMYERRPLKMHADGVGSSPRKDLQNPG